VKDLFKNIFDMTEAEQIEEEIAALEEEQIELKRVQYAKSFREYFDDKFLDINKQSNMHFVEDVSSKDDQTTLTRSEFDKWLEFSGFGSENKIPQTGTPEWSLWVNTRNKVRGEMNVAASIGEHGEPPYRLDVDKDDRSTYILRTLNSMLRVTHKEVIAGLQSILTNKKEHLGTWIYSLQDRIVNSNDQVLKNLVAQQTSVFDLIAENTVDSLNKYLKYLQGIEIRVIEAGKAAKLREKAEQTQLEHQEDIT
jgi:hypothetical protein